MDHEPRLPFRLYGEALDRLQSAIHAGTDMALRGIGRTADAAEEAAAEVPNVPSPAETMSASSALATAINEEARDALAKHVGHGEVTDGLAIHDRPGRVEPARELGPKPFKA